MISWSRIIGAGIGVKGGEVNELRPAWTIFSNHGMVLFYVAANPEATLRSISDALGITERHVARLVKDLEEAGMLRVERRGRHNAYAVDPQARLRHPPLSHVPLGRIVEAIASVPRPS